MLDLYNLYSVPDPGFSWWNGKPGLSFGAFSVADSSGLGTYLDTQRQTVTRLAGSYASPALGGPGLIAPLTGDRAAFWQSILDDLDAYKNKKSGNPLQSLETLIGQTMTEVTLDTAAAPAKEPAKTPSCLTQVAAANAPGDAADFFLSRRNALASGVQSRCLSLVSCRFRQGYEQLSQRFNSRLAGRFPFATREPFRAGGQALPEAITDAYAVFDAYQPYLKPLPQGDPAFGGREGEIRDFMAGMAAVRPLFAPFLDTPQQYPVPTLGFTAELRVNRARELAAAEIFHWILQIGEARFQLGDPQIKGQWSYGSPSSLALVWADNSPDVPLAAESSDWVAVKDRTVTYSYEHPWSLLALIRDSPSAPEDFQSHTDDRPETLKLLIQTRPDPKPPVVQTAEARAFIRVTLTTPDGKTLTTADGKPLLPLPAFPEKAPPAAGLAPGGLCPAGEEP